MSPLLVRTAVAVAAVLLGSGAVVVGLGAYYEPPDVPDAEVV
jgi:hypothetical protein